MSAAETYFGLEPYISAADIPNLDEKSMLVYVSEYYTGITGGCLTADCRGASLPLWWLPPWARLRTAAFSCNSQRAWYVLRARMQANSRLNWPRGASPNFASLPWSTTS